MSSNSKNNSAFIVRALCEGACMVALAQILGYLKLYRMPYGGSVTLIMLPIFIYCMRWGAWRGLLAGFVLGVLQFTLDGGFAIGWQSILGDYVFSYAALFLFALTRRKAGALFIGSVIGAVGRWAVLTVTGATLWASYAPEEFLGLPMVSPWVYSMLYNAIPVGLSLLAVEVVLALLYAPMKKYLRPIL